MTFPSKRIIQPQGKPIRRITIELDNRGQAAVLIQELPGGMGVPASLGDALILSQVNVSVLQSLGNQKGIVDANEQKAEKTNRHDV